MSDGAQFFVKVLLIVIGLYIAYKIVVVTLAALINLVMPLLIVGAIGYVAYLIISRKALGGGRRTLP